MPGDTAAYAGSSSSVQPVTVARVATTTDLATSVTGRSVTLATAVTSGCGVPAGVVELREGDTLLQTVPLSAGAASLTVADVALGDHTYTATYVPTGPFHAGSTSPARSRTVVDPPVTPTPTPTADPLPAPTAAPVVSTSTTTVTAPRKARAGTRPRVTVSVVRGMAAASGTVVVTVGKRSRTLTLRAGTVTLRLPKLVVGKVRITVRYAGDASTTASSARRTIRVKA